MLSTKRNDENLVYDRGNRYIPVSVSTHTYRSNNLYIIGPSVHPPGISLREDMLFIEWYNGVERNTGSNNKATQLQDKQLADALELDQSSHVVKYRTPLQKRRPTYLDIAGPLSSTLGSKDAAFAYANCKSKSALKPAEIKKVNAASILSAPGLRNDFYSNLIAWSPMNNKIAIGLGSHAYHWGIDSEIARFDFVNREVITCVSFSPKSPYLVVGTSSGSVILLNQKTRQFLTKLKLHKKCIYCITWFVDGERLLLGDENGDIYVFVVQNFGFTLINRIKCHHQQICGIAVNIDETEIAVGGNDNCCTIWNIRDLLDVKFQFKLKHDAAVKALAYCPWSKSLLATGGGSKDRNIRFWHTKTGTLLNKFYTNAQVTSVSWSKFSKEIVATFGFGNHTKILIVYTYPDMKPRLEVVGTYGLRILSSVLSPTSTSLAVASNDCTIRIYKLWNQTVPIDTAPEVHAIGTYGSSLIEQSEGIHHKQVPLR